MIVYIITKLELGGAQKVCLALTKGLQAQNLRVTLISGSEGKLVHEAQASGAAILLPSFKREVNYGSGLLTELKNFFILVKTLRALKKTDPKLIVHTHSTKAGILGRWAAFFAGIKNRIHTIHGYGFHDFQSYINWFIIYVLELVTSFITTKFICVSEKDQQTGLRLFPGFKNKSVLIRAAVKGELFDNKKNITSIIKSPIIKKSFIMGTIACFKPQKNIFDLLKAFKIVYDHLASTGGIVPVLEIIGDGDQRKALEDWIKQENLSKAVRLLGWQDDVARWMQSWDLFVLSSLWEGLPCAIIEARLCHLPVISYQVGGISEVIIDGKNGFLVAPHDYKTLAKRIISVIESSKLHQILSMYQDNLDDFNTDVMIKKHLELYSDLTNKTKTLKQARS